jgi:hypothetical protein
MRIDPEEFSRHYASLSDDALLEIDPADLVDVARERYEQELRNRKLSQVYEDDAEESAWIEPDSEEDDGDWKKSAVCAWFFAQTQDVSAAAADAAEADSALQTAGIPSFIEQDPGDADAGERPGYNVMIPASLRLLAESVLDKDIFNAVAESGWKTHFETLSDDDLRALNADDLCAGILDRAARLRKVFADELAHRGIRA